MELQSKEAYEAHIQLLDKQIQLHEREIQHLEKENSFLKARISHYEERVKKYELQLWQAAIAFAIFFVIFVITLSRL